MLGKDNCGHDIMRYRRKAQDNWIQEHWKITLRKNVKIFLLGSDLSQWPAGGQMSLGRQREVQFSLINFRNYVSQLGDIPEKFSNIFFILSIFFLLKSLKQLRYVLSCPLML